MKKVKVLKVMNIILAGLLMVLGFSSCDKDDDVIPDRRNGDDNDLRLEYGPMPVSYKTIDQEDIDMLNEDIEIALEEQE